MTGTELPPRSATIRSRVPEAGTVAAAVAPDDTDEVDTRVEDGAVVTRIERPTTSGLEATIDDAVVALDVATDVVALAAPHAPDASRDGDAPDGSGGPDADDDAPREAQHDDHATETRNPTTHQDDT